MQKALKKGKQYFIRTETMFFTGELKEIYDNGLVISKAKWAENIKKFSNCLFDVKISKGAILNIRRLPQNDYKNS